MKNIAASVSTNYCLAAWLVGFFNWKHTKQSIKTATKIEKQRNANTEKWLDAIS